MITAENRIRVRYDEVDQMGYVFHGNYARYYHEGRTELLRKIGICDKKLDNEGIILPVIEINTKFIKPVFYDDEIIIMTCFPVISKSRMNFSQKIYNQKGEIVNKATITLAYMNKCTRKVIRIPDCISMKLELFENLIN